MKNLISVWTYNSVVVSDSKIPTTMIILNEFLWHSGSLIREDLYVVSELTHIQLLLGCHNRPLIPSVVLTFSEGIFMSLRILLVLSDGAEEEYLVPHRRRFSGRFVWTFGPQTGLPRKSSTSEICDRYSSSFFTSTTRPSSFRCLSCTGYNYNQSIVISWVSWK